MVTKGWFYFWGLILLLRVDSTSDSTYSCQAEFSRCLEEVTIRSRPIWQVGIKPIISCISWVTGQKTYHNLTRCMTFQGFRSVPMRWYNINVQKKSLSWITLDYTAHLHTTERVRWEFQWTIFWCELPCVGSLTLCFWLEILWGWYWYWVFIGKKIRRSIRPSELISLYLVLFGVNYPSFSCSCYQASRLNTFVFLWSQVTKVDSKRSSKTDIQDVSRMWSTWQCDDFFLQKYH